ncbi:MAG: DUF308 domain-containing protein [Eubacterium sp.]|nr:DUF308 domain-containing protein [Eubacterium sp.]
MTLWQKCRDVLIGLAMIAVSVIMVMDPGTGFYIVSIIVCFGLFFLGIKALIFYQTMARHMVGGRIQLYRGIILLDLGLFTLSLNSIPKAYLVLYLMGIHAFAGVVDILRARESKTMDSPGWKRSLMSGLGNLLMAVLCLVFGFMWKNADAVVYTYAAGLVYGGVLKIANAFKRTEVVYIQ